MPESKKDVDSLREVPEKPVATNILKEVEARRKIIQQWMEKVTLDSSKVQISFYESLKQKLGVLAVHVDLSQVEIPTVWEMIEKTIPEGQRKLFPASATEIFQHPLSGKPYEIVQKSDFLTAHSPVKESFDRLLNTMDSSQKSVYVFLCPPAYLSK